MAQDKRSIIVYSDWIAKFEALADDEAGRLIKHFFRYVNDQNPIAPDRITEISFIDIKQSLKRDLKQWENIKDSRSKAGKVGGVKSGEIRKKQIEANEAIALNSKQIEANEAVSVNVSVNDIVINKDNNTRDESRAVDFVKFIEFFNSLTGRKFRVTEKIKRSLILRSKEYGKKQIIEAVKNAHKDPFHIDTKFKHLTPEFILRIDKLEKFLNMANQIGGGYSPQIPN